MRQLVFVLIYLVILAVLSSCSDSIERNDQVAQDEEVIEQMLDIAESNSIHRYNLDWQDVRKEVLGEFNISGFEASVVKLLMLLGDNHSFYISSDESTVIGYSTLNCTPEIEMHEIEHDSIGYVKIEGFSGDHEQQIQFAQNIQDRLEQQDNEYLLGWVIDLTNNTGGNMYPMITGLGPIFGDDLLGYFIDPNSTRTSWGYDDNGSFTSEPSNKIVSLSVPYELKKSNPKVAVIIDNKTSSSGEALAIAFKGRDNTVIIGRKTCGLSTVNSNFNLINNDVFILTVSAMADRNGNTYDFGVHPDLSLKDPFQIENEILEWMKD